MKRWTRSVFLGTRDLQEQLRAEIVRRWPEARYPFHIQVIGEDATGAIGVRVWTDDGIHIFEEADPWDVGYGEDTRIAAAVFHAVELALREAGSEKLAINQGVP